MDNDAAAKQWGLLIIGIAAACICFTAPSK